MNKLAIIGMGDMGSKYAKMIFEDRNLGYEIVATTRVKGNNLLRVQDYISNVIVYDSDKDLFDGFDRKEFECDTVLVVTPHMAHKYAVIEGFKRGLSVLCDKPAAVSLKDGREMYESQNENKYGFVFHHRTFPIYQELRNIIQSKKYGETLRVNFVVTDWFRINEYYTSSKWHARYKTDGGGILLNQCPHSLDLLCYVFGLPSYVFSMCNEGRYHDIEVEDDVTTMLRWPDGTTGVFIASTGELTDINRMEISTTKALITVYKNHIEIKENDKESSYYLNLGYKEYKAPIPKITRLEFEKNEPYKDIIKGFHDGNIFASGYDSLLSLYLSNAMYLSSWKNKAVELHSIGSEKELAFENEFEEELKKRQEMND